MQAAVFEGNGVLRVQEVQDPGLQADDEAILRVAANGVCGTDVHALDVPPKVAFHPGVVIGHEFSGTVVETGSACGFRAGEKVGVLPQIPCYQCQRCRDGKINLCRRMSVFGAYERNGGAAEYVTVPSEVMYRLDERLPVELAALAEPLSVTLSASVRINWHPGRSVVVFGAGPIGLLFLLYAISAGASPVFVVEPTQGRREFAQSLGADYVIDPTQQDVVQVVQDRTPDGADIIVDSVGVLLPQAIEVAATGAQIIVFGIDESASVQVPPYQILRKEITITGTFLAKNTFPLALKLLTENKQGFDRLVTRFPLGEAPAAVEQLRQGRIVKAFLIP
jgi:(R,R)-butanediol dehydrogenase / meso-butanediol dehydrogenase / diacetyl reductase